MRALSNVRTVTRAMAPQSRTIISSMFASPVEEGVAMTTPLPGVAVSTGAGAASTSTEMTTLPNGMRVVSENSPGATACVGVFVGSGSRDETDATAGATHMMEHMAFKTTPNRSHFRTVHEAEHLGANMMAQAGREEIVYSAEVLSENSSALLEIIAETLTEPSSIEHEMEDGQMNTHNLTTEAAHMAAYGNTGLGRPLMCSEKGLGGLTPGTMKAHASSILTSGNIVVAASGVDHKAFVEDVGKYFASIPEGAAPAKEKANYIGGQYSVPADSADGLAHVTLAFQGPTWHDAELIPMCVLHPLMGGGGSFSAGGPGKGMYSRLYTGVLNRHGWVQNATAFNSCYQDNGLFGVYGAAEPRALGNLVEVLSEQLKGMGGELSDEEFERAKKMTKSP